MVQHLAPKNKFMKLLELISESEEKKNKFCEFAEKRLGGATKIVENAKEKGGPAMLTYHHFVVKLPYYKKASAGNFDLDDAKKEYKEHLDKLCDLGSNMNQVEFQKLVGLIEVLGELIIKHK
jgi:hypothetical protein